MEEKSRKISAVEEKAVGGGGCYGIVPSKRIDLCRSRLLTEICRFGEGQGGRLRGERRSFLSFFCRLNDYNLSNLINNNKPKLYLGQKLEL